MKENSRFPTIQLITREKNTEYTSFAFGVDLRSLLKNNNIPELKEGKDGYLKISPADGKLFFDSKLEPVKNLKIYKITHLKETDRLYLNFINQDESQLLKSAEENNISIMNIPALEEISKLIALKTFNSFRRKNSEKVENWHWEKNALSTNKIAKFAKEVFGFWKNEPPKAVEQKNFEFPEAVLSRPVEHLGIGEWALVQYCYKYLKDAYELVYSRKDYKPFYGKFMSAVEQSIDSIEIKSEKGIRVYGHNGLYFYQFYHDALNGDFCEKCGKFLETELTPNGTIRKNRRTFCKKSDNLDCYRKRKAENQKKWVSLDNK